MNGAWRLRNRRRQRPCRSALPTGTAGAVTLDVTGSIVAPGVNSTAVFAQSDGPDGVGRHQCDQQWRHPRRQRHRSRRAAVGGADNLVSISGTLSAVSGLAMESGTGNDRLENTGIVVGNAHPRRRHQQRLQCRGRDLHDDRHARSPGGCGQQRDCSPTTGNLLLGRSAPRYPIDLAAGETWIGERACRAAIDPGVRPLSRHRTSSARSRSTDPSSRLDRLRRLRHRLRALCVRPRQCDRRCDGRRHRRHHADLARKCRSGAAVRDRRRRHRQRARSAGHDRARL